MHSVLNEGSLMDVVNSIASDTINSAKDARNKNKSTYMHGSISKYTQKLILSFPTICDNTIPISTAQMISKAHEKNLVSMFEILFSSMALEGTNGIEILKALHHNLNDNSSIDDIIDAIEKSVGESGMPFTQAELRDIISEMCYELKYKQKVLTVESLSEGSLNDYLVRESAYGTVVIEASNGNNKQYTQKDVNDAYDRGRKAEKGSNQSRDYDDRHNKAQRDEDEYYGRSVSAKEDRRREERDEDIKRADEKEKQRQKERKEDIDRRSTERTEDKDQRTRERKEDKDQRRQERKEDSELRLAQSRVKDVDYKKSNELQPSLLTVTYSVLTPDGKSVTGEHKSFVAGIKSRLVGSDAMEIVERISAAKSNKLTFKDIVRATTGEISLVKDFILATKQAKLNAKNAAKRGETAKMWNLLSVRAKKNAVTGKGMNSNEAASITTLVINQETANYLANQYKMNLDSPKEAAEIMKNYNLLCLVIADEANEVAKFLYDGNNSFEMISYSSLSKDMRDDKSYNKAINLFNKSGR